MSNIIKKGMQEIFSYWMKQVTEEYQKKYDIKKSNGKNESRKINY